MAATRISNSFLFAKKSEVDHTAPTKSIATSLPSSPSKRIISSAGSVSTPDLVSPRRGAAMRPRLLNLSTSSTTAPKTTTPVVLTMTDIFSDDGFCDLQVPPAELRPSATLTNGQCFHWTAVSSTNDTTTTTSSAWGTHNATEWIGTIRNPSGDSAVLVLRELPNTVHYKVVASTTQQHDWDARAYLQDYFQLSSPQSLAQLYAEWSKQCPRMRRIADSIPGVRILNQDPWECLVSFLCSSNNNIPRITQMLQAIRREYGAPLLQLADGRTWYSFPSLSELMTAATEQDLRQRCGLGYRAKYLIETMQLLHKLGGESYLHSLRAIRDPVVVQEALMQFCGVGRKVADCVALFSLQQDNAIPVDVHVWNIARRDYYNDTAAAATKSLTPTIYRQVGDVFRERFKVKSGWAHSLLFVAELPSFRPALTVDVLEEMDKVSDWWHVC